MQTLRRVHLYLGCFFAPLLVFFAASGLWQMMPRKRSAGEALLLSLHHGRGLKTGEILTLSSPALRCLAGLMAISLVLNIVLGLVMAFRFGHSRPAGWSLFLGFATPAALIVLSLVRAAASVPG